MAQSVVYTKEQLEKASYPDLLENNLVTSPIPLKRLDTKHGRTYYQRNVAVEDRTYIYSSTTIIDNVLDKGIGFKMWLGNAKSYEDAMEYANKRAEVGNITHALCMYLIWGEMVDCRDGFLNEDSLNTTLGKRTIVPIPDEVKLRLQAFIDFCKEYKPKSIATEISLYTDDRLEDGSLLYPWAGTADNIMKIDGKLWLIDIKTGKEYKNHELQLTSYKILWDHLFANELGKIDEMACLYLNARGKFKLVKYKFVPEDWFTVYRLFEYNLKDKRGNMPKVVEKEPLPDIYTLREKKESKDVVK
jgi:hypothetical protein